MKRFAAAIVTICLMFAARPSAAALVLSADGKTVDDTSTGLTWLANADLPASPQPGQPDMQFGLGCSAAVTTGCIGPSGDMNWSTAVKWIAALNADDYEEHSNWQLPAQGHADSGCSATGRLGNSFAFNCSGGAMGDLFYHSLGLAAFNSAVPVAKNTVPVPGTNVSFTNFQPNFYWSNSQNPNPNAPGYLAFNFATGQGDTIVGVNSPKPPGAAVIAGTFLNILPMIQTTNPTTSGPLQSVLNGGGIYDPATGVIWAANANLATDQTLVADVGMTFCGPIGTNGPNGGGNCVNRDGTMNWSSAYQFVMGLNTIHYLGTTGWTLPMFGNPGCQGAACADPSQNPLANLYYNDFGLPAGSNIAPPAAPTAANDPFQNIEPSYYWGCQAANESNPLASPCDYDAMLPETGFGWDFSLGNGLDSTDGKGQEFYVTAYYVTPEPSGLAILLPAAGLLAMSSRRPSGQPRRLWRFSRNAPQGSGLD